MDCVAIQQPLVGADTNGNWLSEQQDSMGVQRKRVKEKKKEKSINEISSNDFSGRRCLCDDSIMLSLNEKLSLSARQSLTSLG